MYVFAPDTNSLEATLKLLQWVFDYRKCLFVTHLDDSLKPILQPSTCIINFEDFEDNEQTIYFGILQWHCRALGLLPLAELGGRTPGPPEGCVGMASVVQDGPIRALHGGWP